MTIDQQVRRAIGKSGKSYFQLAIESGVNQSVISRYMQEKKPMQISRDNLERLLPVLGLQLKLVKVR